MGEADTKLKRALRSLCRDNGWSYGVLWRFDPRNPMLLTMEDAFYEEDRMRQVIGNMLPQVHVLGEGAIGKSALTGKHHWMFAVAPESQEEADLEVLHQFSVGVETLVVIPLEHMGVVQFGATKKIMETSPAKFVDDAKKLFCETDNVHGNLPSSSNSETHDINSMFGSILSHGNLIRSGNNAGLGLEELVRNNFSTMNQIQFSEFGNDGDLSQLFSVKGGFGDRPCLSSWSNEGSVLTSLELPMPAGSFGIDHLQSLDGTGVELPKASCGLKRSFDEFNSANLIADVSAGSCLVDDLSQWLVGSPEHGVVVGPAGCFEDSIEQSILVNSGNYGCLFDGNSWDILNNNNPTPNNAAPRKGLFSELGIEELLEGSGNGFAKSSFKDNHLSSKTIGAEGSLRISGTDGYGHREFLHKSQVGLWIDDSYSINAGGGAPVCPSKRAEEQAKPVRKRARPGESTRPRPKDRQQIQDRLKELRGIIPNGAKCSIDALLDRTIKHMMFLQNVTRYADKLKQPDEPKLKAHENGVVLKDEISSSGGTTWAFEVGSQSMVCPIIVEDLSSPGQMLIEMLCEERGFFLEIADMIRGFGLNILKGVIEVRDGKIWSHFIVEATTRHVTRMDVFWSLVQLLQQTAPTTVQPDSSRNRPDYHLTDGAVLPCKSYNQSLLSLPIS